MTITTAKSSLASANTPNKTHLLANNSNKKLTTSKIGNTPSYLGNKRATNSVSNRIANMAIMTAESSLASANTSNKTHLLANNSNKKLITSKIGNTPSYLGNKRATNSVSSRIANMAITTAKSSLVASANTSNKTHLLANNSNKKPTTSKVGNVANNNKKATGNVANLIAHTALSVSKQPIIKTKPNSVSNTKPTTSNVDIPKSAIRLSPAERQALAMEASYTDFSEFDDKKVKEALEGSRSFNSHRKAEAFVNNFEVLAQLPNSEDGSSALILKNKHSGHIHWVARGTDDIQDGITDVRLTISGRPKYQELEQLNFYSRLSTPKNQPAPQYEYAKQYITGPNKMAMKVDNTDKIVLKKSTAQGLGVINKTDYIEFNGHSLAMPLGEGLRYVIPNPSKIYGANGAGLRQSSANKKFYEETRKLVSGNTATIDWNKYNSSSTNTVTTGKPTIVASNTVVLPQNGSVQKLPQPINGTEGHRISHFTQSQITKAMVESMGLNYQEFVQKHQEAHNKQAMRERINGTMRNEIHTLINHEKLAINRTARFLEETRRYTEPSGTEKEKEAIDKNNKDLLMDLRLRTPLLEPKQKRQLKEILNKPVEPLELSRWGKTPTLNSNIARQTDSLIQAMAIANKRREGEVELTNLSASSDISLTFNHT